MRKMEKLNRGLIVARAEKGMYLTIRGRNSAASQNICYNQVGFASFYLGDEAPLPAKRTDICFG